MVSASLSDDDLNYTEGAITQRTCSNALTSKAQGKRENNVSETEIYHTSSLAIIIQSFKHPHFLELIVLGREIQCSLPEKNMCSSTLREWP